MGGRTSILLCVWHCMLPGPSFWGTFLPAQAPAADTHMSSQLHNILGWIQIKPGRLPSKVLWSRLGRFCWAIKTRKFSWFRKAASLFCKWQCRQWTEENRKQSLHYFDYSLEHIFLPQAWMIFRVFFYFCFWSTLQIQTAESSSFSLLLSSLRCSPHGDLIPAWTFCINILSFAMELASWCE